MTVAIDKGVQMPAPGGRGRPPNKYPFPDMQVGDSILCAEASARQAAFAWGKNHGARFVCRKVDGGIRIWRYA